MKKLSKEFDSKRNEKRKKYLRNLDRRRVTRNEFFLVGRKLLELLLWFFAQSATLNPTSFFIENKANLQAVKNMFIIKKKKNKHMFIINSSFPFVMLLVQSPQPEIGVI